MAPDRQDRRRIVIDGSNIATEGRTVPSLAQLDEAIRSFLEEYQGFASSDVTVVVDASFGHRIDPSEVVAFEQALDHGEMITPPAGAVGRGDGFILRIAEKSGALVLSNDSFQEFHAERPWLFEPGRLIGGKPVPGVGWVFTPRAPVRGARSRTVSARAKRDGTGAESEDAEQTNGTAARANRVAKKKATKDNKGGPAKSQKAAKATKAGAAKTGKADKSAKAARSSGKAAKAPKLETARASGSKKNATSGTMVDGASTVPDDGPSAHGKAKKAAGKTKTTEGKTKTTDGKARKGNPAEVAVPATRSGKAGTSQAANAGKVTKAGKNSKAGKDSKAGKGTTATPSTRPAGEVTALNEPATFLHFVASHPVGSTLEGTVASFTSHGAHIEVDGMLCHVPLRGLGDPPPTRARQVLAKGETRRFVLVSVDAARRRAALSLPGLAPH